MPHFVTVKEIVECLDEFDDDQTIYVSSLSPAADAVVDFETEDGQVPASASGLHYLLEVSIARDVVRVWSDWRGGNRPTLPEKIEAILYYAEHDSFQPVG